MKTLCNAELHVYTKEMERCTFAPSTDKCSIKTKLTVLTHV
jgi:hypothetical protein